MDEDNSCRVNVPEPNEIVKLIRELNSAFKKNFITCGTAAGLDEVTLMDIFITIRTKRSIRKRSSRILASRDLP